MPLFPEIQKDPEKGIAVYGVDRGISLIPGDSAQEAPQSGFPPNSSFKGGEETYSFQQVENDGAESICVDDQDVLEIEDAIRIVHDTREKRNLTEFEAYQRDVAKTLISREFRNHSASPWGRTSVFSKDSNRGSRAPRMGGIFFTENYAPETASAEPYDSDDLGSVYTVNIDRARALSNSQASATSLSQSITIKELCMLLLGGSINIRSISECYNTIGIAGPFGSLLGFTIGAIMYLAIILPVVEMMSVTPLQGGMAAYVKKYVSVPLGFATGLAYFISCTMFIPASLLETVRLLALYPALNTPDKGNLVWLTFFVILIFLFNLFPSRGLGKGGHFLATGVVIVMCMIMIFFCVFNAGGVPGARDHIGFRYFDSSKSHGHHTYGLFQSTFGKSSTSGSGARFMQVVYAITSSFHGILPIDKVLTAVPEVRNPRKALKRGAKFILVRVFLFHILLLFTMVINVSPSSKLLSPNFALPWTTVDGDIPACTDDMIPCGIQCSRWTNLRANSTSIPWYIPLLEHQICTLVFVMNAFFLFLGVFQTVIQLYSASRTLYGLAIENYVWKFFASTTRDSVPHIAVIASIVSVAIAYFAAFSDLARIYYVIQFIVLMFSLLSWVCLGLASIRFRHALKLSEYSQEPQSEYGYRSWFNVYMTAGSSVLLVLIILTLPVMTSWAADTWCWWTFLLYITVIGFVAVTILYKVLDKSRSTATPLNEIDFSRVKEHLDEQEWEEDRVYHKEFRGTLMLAKRRVGYYSHQGFSQLMSWIRSMNNKAE